MGKTVSVHTILGNEYPVLGVSEEVRRTLGNLETGFTSIVYGASGSGKTTYCLGVLAPYLATHHGKVYYNSTEQGEGSAVQEILTRYPECAAVPQGRFMFGDRDTFPEMQAKIKGMRPMFIFLDSLDYMNLTVHQYKQLLAICHQGPKRHWRSLIIISWSQHGRPRSQHGKGIEYMVDVKVQVEAGCVRAKSRFGATEPYYLWKPKIGGKQGSLF